MPPVPLSNSPSNCRPTTRGEALFVCGSGGVGWAGRIDFDPLDPMAWSWTPASDLAFTGGGRRLAIDPDDASLAIETENPLILRFFDARTMVATGSVPLPNAATASAIAWG